MRLSTAEGRRSVLFLLADVDRAVSWSQLRRRASKPVKIREGLVMRVSAFSPADINYLLGASEVRLANAKRQELQLTEAGRHHAIGAQALYMC